MKDDLTYRDWLKMHKEDLEWIIEMAQKGIDATEGGMDHPANVLLYDFKCNVEAAGE